MPPDIERRISKYFSDDAVAQEVRKRISALWTVGPLGVGPEQLARSILILAESDVAIVRQLFESNFLGDPRDTVTAAERKLGWTKNWGLTPFDDAES